ncbi:MAG: 2'-5' RNA ligase [Candidatus Solincola sediminis]|uniref:RNA 2',3'-cyclic phosphodiesterase n=1 Tax=Candidatus Solincola sediminis TaxID=1797199 RepID=A0A1F2WGN2_9ACTN|nr:MAG: 2'-5' RNA ligase [Candidatus Solincola sediminis]OFW58281.1 MAG: 2'-5' RNA ligase [Candidatus Solincola sediminis]
MPERKIRLFVAMDIPDDIRGLLSDSMTELEGTLSRARWVKAENLHLTLKFIGYLEREKFEKLSAEVCKAAERAPGFRARFGKPGAFPTQRRARVMWIGMEEGSEEARKIAMKLDARLEKLGVKREKRPFAGHLTLARLKEPIDCADYLENLGNRLEGLENMPFDVREITLYESILSSKGPTYDPLERVQLKVK